MSLEILTGETRHEMLLLLRRSRRSIPELAGELGLTDNAVRTHLSSLVRDGLVEAAGTQRGTGGKPARLYALTQAGEELFPKAYAFVLGELIAEIARTEGPAVAIERLRAVGHRAGSRVLTPAGLEARLTVAVELLRQLGGDIEVQRTAAGWRLQGHGCPLSSVAAEHPEVCTLATALVEKVTGRPVTECCDRSSRPRCAFEVPGPDAAA